MTSGNVRRSFFGIVWWNVNNFLHFAPEKVSDKADAQWPQSKIEYAEKCRKVDFALRELFQALGIPKILALGEITRRAATELRDRLLPTYRVLSLDVKHDAPTPQVAILYAPDNAEVSFAEQTPIVVSETPRSTRPMAVLDAKINDHTIRIVVCHWQSKIGEDGAAKIRDRIAHRLSLENYDFITKDCHKHHLAIVGDFNEEPFESAIETLHAHRDRRRSKGRPHWKDGDVKRLHLYNTSWRLLGEKHPHSPNRTQDNSLEGCAGTYYWAAKKTWRHFDQFIVSAGLLGSDSPHIDESEIVVVSSSAFLTDGLPMKFSFEGDKYVGLSDHLPIYANIYI
jgi:hypothetical protein